MDIPQWLAVEEAARMWERAFGDDITVTIAIRVREAPGGLRAETNSSLVTHSLEDVRQALIADADFQFERLIDEQIPVPLPINDNPPRFGLTITMPSANAKALGLSIGRDPEFTNPNVPEGMDALITVTTPSHENFLDHFDLDPRDGIDEGKADFVGIVAHELGHAFVALRNKIPVKSISLFFLGGVAEIDREPSAPGEEFRIAIAGPMVSLTLALIFNSLAQVSGDLSYLSAAFSYLGRVNLLLGVFNLIPGFPMDGGRILRAAIWKITGDHFRATQAASSSSL